ncbi:GT4 family glycosyltransferase PelF [Flavobacterium sp. MAH-1]|uniref:GT4 family glycosyltransferase PelF n=1 Tax=Flavobacterium agri TaxID=2743471 RepID=A0A7Y9C523_9FLAO|nr:GT4 family glycosyltransferase PelF [Flavobacterium agri]NUY79909.1 GT4 family glycosyltransferase PelF [Flavobacterium agri]NYA69934.1 GT4 family glycosyltransferase PelF [Flavobacterium agri]
MSEKYNVLLILEGTYPYNGGGVSTWAHMLCSDVSNANYSLYSINADFETKPKYELSDNVKDVVQVPLWSPLEPQEMINYGKKFHKFVERKENTNDTNIENIFLPIFERLIKTIYAANPEAEDMDDVIFDMWRYFQKNDYKKTMRSKQVWDAFRYLMHDIIVADKDEEATLYDLTVAMRWIYRFLIPLSIDVPKADLTHLTLSGFPVIPALVLKYKYGTPMIVTEHGVFIRERLIAINASEYSFFLKKMLIKFSEAITSLVYHKADRILSVNKFNMIWEKMYGADPNKIDVIYNGIDHKLFVPKAKPEHLVGTPTVVAAARIFELKDIITMIKSCAVVKQVIPNVKYLVYGDNNAVPEYTAECNKLISELGLEDNFILAGFHNKPHELFCEGDISILTSISEGFPYTVLESMSCGIPVVATDVGGVTEALDPTCGFICKPKDHVEIGNSVITLLQDKALREKMGANARKKVAENFTIGKFIYEYEQVYDRMLSKRTKQVVEPIFIELERQEAS